MIVTLSISQWTARKLDRKASREVAANHGSDEAWGRYNKRLVAEDAIKKVAKTATDARTYHYENTLPWDDKGGRILPAANYMEYTSKMRTFRDRFEAAVAELLDNYPSLVADARIALNGLFRQGDYPPAHQIARRYSFSTDVSPIPSGGDFRVALDAECVQQIREEIEQRTEEMATAAMRDLWDRLYTAVRHMADRLSEPGKDGKPPIFRDSLVNNLRDLAALLPRLNLTNDPDLERMRQSVVDELTATEPEVLRTDVHARREAAEKANAIAQKMGAFMA
jgi:hypothetical protein